jgi:hypothetical protein
MNCILSFACNTNKILKYLKSMVFWVEVKHSLRDPDGSEAHTAAMFRVEEKRGKRINLPPSSTGALLRLLFDPEYGQDMFFRNVISLSLD